MIMKEEQWGNISLLHIVEDKFVDQEIPVVIFHHGFTSAKEHNLHYAYNLAKKGVRVLLPDAHLHGARAENLDEVELSLRFWEIVLTSIEEMAFLFEELKSRGFVTTAKIGIGGTSMGGITTLGALSIYKWIDSTIVMMGSPGFVDLAKAQISQFEADGFELPINEEEKSQLYDNLSTFDLTKNISALNNRPIYFWHGKKDPVVPYAPTYLFYKALKEHYVDTADASKRFVFVTDKVAAHTVTRSGMLGAIEWLASYLNE